MTAYIYRRFIAITASAVRSRCGHHIFILWFLLSSIIFPRLISAIADSMSTILTQQYLLHMPLQYGELRPTSGWDRFVSLGNPANENRYFIITGSINKQYKYGIIEQKNNLYKTYNYVKHKRLIVTQSHSKQLWFQRVSRLRSVTARHSSIVGVSQTLRRWTKGATYIRQGGHYVGHWPTIYSCHSCSRKAKVSLRFHATSHSHRFYGRPM